MIKLISYQKKDYLEKTSMHVLRYHIHTFCDKNSDGVQKLINVLFFSRYVLVKSLPTVINILKPGNWKIFQRICNSTKSSTCKIKTCQKTLPWSSGSRQCCNGMTYCTFYLWCAVHLRGLGKTWKFNMKCYWYVRIK